MEIQKTFMEDMKWGLDNYKSLQLNLNIGGAKYKYKERGGVVWEQPKSKSLER
jgi:hypothetical protein